MGLGGKNLRLKKDNLDKQIVPGESKCIVKKNKVTIKMKKVKFDLSDIEKQRGSTKLK